MRQLLFKAKALFTKKQRTQQEPAELGELLTELGPKETFFSENLRTSQNVGYPYRINCIYFMLSLTPRAWRMLVAKIPW